MDGMCSEKSIYIIYNNCIQARPMGMAYASERI